MSDDKLTQDQAEKIVEKSLEFGFFELDVNGSAPKDPRVIMEVATEILRQSRLSFHAGNHGDGVRSILAVADSLYQIHTPAQSAITGGEQMAEQDLSAYPVEMLRKFEGSLMNYPQPHQPEVLKGIADVQAELVKRGEAPAGTVVAAAPVTAPAEIPLPPQADPLMPTEEQKAERAGLEDRLTLSMMRAHSIDPSQIEMLTMAELRRIVDGEVPMQQPQPAVTVEVASPETIVPTSPTIPVPTPDSPSLEGLQRAAALSGGSPPPPVAVPLEPGQVSKFREDLEEKITGPLLKAWGQGRRSVPDIGDNVLSLMIQYPTAGCTQEQLDNARARDEAGTPAEGDGTLRTGAEPAIPPAPVAVAPAPVAPVAAAPEPVLPWEDDPAEQVRDEARDGAVEAPQVVAPAPSPFDPPPPAPEAPRAAPRSVQAPLSPIVEIEIEEGRAQKIIDRENFPVPPEVPEPPMLPADMSTLTAEQLYSVHARFHAAEVRCGWILGLEEDKLHDVQKLLRGRKVEVANNLPIKDGRVKLTDAQRDAMVASDEGILKYQDAEHEIKKVVRQLRALEQSYHSSVERASRQMNRFSNEISSSGR